MNTDNPFETFQQEAFRLEALPHYIVEDEKEAFSRFKQFGELTYQSDSEWTRLVKTNVASSKSMKRLRLLSSELTPYEQFELLSYPGVDAGEEIRVNARSLYEDKYLYDFWFFDNEYITQMYYGVDGVYIDKVTRKANDDEKKMLAYWMSIFEESDVLE